MLTRVTDFTKLDNKDAAAVLKRLYRQVPVLKGIHKDKNVRVATFYSDKSASHLVMTHILQDETAEKYYKLYGLPRGFPTIITQTSIFLYGFYGKFKNDQRQVGSLHEFKGAQKMHLTVKYSGFLGMPIAWDDPSGAVYCTTTSKNSVGNEFSENGAELYHRAVPDETIVQLFRDGWYVAGECMSHQDQAHGARVLEEAFVPTCVGKFTRLNGDEVHTGTLSGTVDHETMHKVCQEYKIQPAELWTVAGSEQILKIAEQLEEQRDFMTYDRLREVLSDIPSSGHAADHAKILGAILEGLVIWLVDEDGNVRAIKYKFAVYTSRTFGIRTALGNDLPWLSTRYKSHVDGYLNFWVVSEPGKVAWRKWFYALALRASRDELDGEHDPLVGQHIHYADQMGLQCSADGPIAGIEHPVEDFIAAVGLPPITGTRTVIVVLGPIGSGKSTCGNALECQHRHAWHIDGDELYPKEVISTMSLGKERNAATQYMILAELFNGKVPIISCGGGVLFSGGNHCILRDLLEEKLGHSLHLALYLPCPKSEIAEFYRTWNVSSVIQHRLDTGAWTCTKKPEKFIEEIQRLSQSNAKFAHMLSKMADEVHTFAPVTPKTDMLAWRRDLPLPEEFYVGEGRSDTVHAAQVRILVRIQQKTGKTGHFTVHHSNGLRPISTNMLRDLKKALNGTVIDGHMMQAKACSFARPTRAAADKLANTLKKHGFDERSPEDLHVTINPGKFFPATMRDACLQLKDYDALPEADQRTASVTILDKTDAPVTVIGWKRFPAKIQLIDILVL